MTSEWFPTAYSMSNHSEWYAECFGVYVFGNLHGEPARFFAQFIK